MFQKHYEHYMQAMGRLHPSVAQAVMFSVV